MQILLRVNVPDRPEKKVRISRDVIIGREKGRCDLRIASGDVSRKHCQILIGEYAVLVRDLDSANGTRINGELIPAQTNFPLNSGDILAIGPLTICAEPVDDSTADDSSDQFLSQHDALAALDTPQNDAELSSLDILIENRLQNDADDYASMQPTWDAIPVAENPGNGENFEPSVSENQLEQEVIPSLACDDNADDIEELELADDDLEVDTGRAALSDGRPVLSQPSGEPDHPESETIVPEAVHPANDDLADLISEEGLIAEDELIPLGDPGPSDGQAAGVRSDLREPEQAETGTVRNDHRADENGPADDDLAGFLNQFDSPG